MKGKESFFSYYWEVFRIGLIVIPVFCGVIALFSVMGGVDKEDTKLFLFIVPFLMFILPLGRAYRNYKLEQKFQKKKKN